MAEEVGMLRKFRGRFILMTMILVGIVSLIAFAFVGVSDYNAMEGQIATSLKRATEPAAGWNWHTSLSPNSSSSSDDDDDNADGGSSGSSKGSNSSRGYIHSTIPICALSVSYGDNTVYTGVYDSIGLDDDTIKRAVSQALACTQSGDLNGDGLHELGGFGLYYQVNATQSGYKVAFVPTSTLWDSFMQDVVKLVGAWLVLMLAVFVITWFMSRYVAHPVEKAWKDQQRFIADASHELKTPLTVIMADVSILKDAPEKTVQEQSNWVEGISNEAERMKQLTEDLLTLAQADAGVDMRQIMGDVDFSSVVEGQVLQFDAVAFERGLTISDEQVQESLHVVGDQMRLENMVKTLLENACKYAEQPGTIDVSLQQVRGDAVLKIHNTGEPIPAEDLPHLFDRFYRSDKARTHEGEAASFGLGLSIAKSTAEMHKGDIAVDSDETGTTFTVKIPLAKASRS